MRILLTLVGLLFSSVAVADPTEKAINDIRDIASLIAADFNKCGVVRIERVDHRCIAAEDGGADRDGGRDRSPARGEVPSSVNVKPRHLAERTC